MNRSFVGNFLLFSFAALAISGTVMYFYSFQKSVVSIHTLFALLFLVGIGFHLFNNLKPLKNYLSGRRIEHLAKYNSLIIFLVFTLIALGSYFDIIGFNGLYNWGNEFRNNQLGKKESSFDYEVISLENSTFKAEIRIEVKKGASFQYPLFAIWMEDSAHNYIETLYISRVIASGVYDYGVEVDGEWKPSSKRRPEALPFWSHKRNIQAEDGYYIPMVKAPDLDGVSGATPTNSFIVESGISENLKSFRILLEVNQSYDWNEYFHEKKYPDDSIYSGSGQVGQPSLIYTTEFIQTGNKEKYFMMTLLGHGHHSGKNGELYSDLSPITTAKEIIDRIIVEF